MTTTEVPIFSRQFTGNVEMQSCIQDFYSRNNPELHLHLSVADFDKNGYSIPEDGKYHISGFSTLPQNSENNSVDDMEINDTQNELIKALGANIKILNDVMTKQKVEFYALKKRDKEKQAELDFIMDVLKQYKVEQERYRQKDAENQAKICLLEDLNNRFGKEIEMLWKTHGENLSYQDKLNAEIALQASKIEYLERVNTQQAITINEQATIIAQHEATIAKHEATIAKHEATIAQQAITNKEQATIIAKHEATIAKHEATIAQQAITINEQAVTIAEQGLEIAALKQLTSEQGVAIAQLQTSIAALMLQMQTAN